MKSPELCRRWMRLPFNSLKTSAVLGSHRSMFPLLKCTALQRWCDRPPGESPAAAPPGRLPNAQFQTYPPQSRCAPSEHRVRHSGFSEPVHSISDRLVGPLPKVNLPRQSSVPVRQTLASHVVVHRAVWMKNQYQRRQPNRRNSAGKFFVAQASIAIFVDTQNAWAHLVNGRHIIEPPRFRRCRQSPGRYAFKKRRNSPRYSTSPWLCRKHLHQPVYILLRVIQVRRNANLPFTQTRNHILPA